MIAYLSQNADKRIFDAFRREGFDAVPLAPFSALSHPVDTHADMLLCDVGDTVFVHEDYQLELKGFKNIVKINEEISSKYPNDVLLNVAIVGKNAFANVKFASKSVLEHLKSNGFAIHHVSQGYAHCSTCIVSDCAIITADVGIFETARKTGLDALLISSRGISLPPYEYGFIGGACGSHEGKIYFCGSLKYHPDGDKIRDFCVKHGKAVIELCDAPLMDVGGILFK